MNKASTQTDAVRDEVRRAVGQEEFLAWFDRVVGAVRASSVEARTLEGWIAWVVVRALAPERREKVAAILRRMETVRVRFVGKASNAR